MAYVVYYESTDQTTLTILRISQESLIRPGESQRWLDKPDLHRLRALLGGVYQPCVVYTPQHRHQQADQIMYLIL